LQIASTVRLVLWVVAMGSIWLSGERELPAVPADLDGRAGGVNISGTDHRGTRLVSTIASICSCARHGWYGDARGRDPGCLGDGREPGARPALGVDHRLVVRAVGPADHTEPPVQALILTLLVVQVQRRRRVLLQALTYVGGLLIRIAGALAPSTWWTFRG
jgi:hypothetical protein